MDRLIALGRLFDYYGAFLTARQQSLVRQYAYENLSLGEIAEREGISRQGVRDGVVRAERELLDMEEKLRLVEKTAAVKRAEAAIRRELAPLPAAQREPIERELTALGRIWEDEDGV